MACVHNQKIIDDLNAQITQKKEEIASLLSNVSTSRQIINKHTEFSEKLEGCVKKNLEDGNNIITFGRAYDKGAIDNCVKEVNKTIDDCWDIYNSSTKQIDTLHDEIDKLEAEIVKYSGDCYDCIAEERYATS